ncbi:hypothetical protein Micbo1qcDRAFT_162093 [Microdochium bolleyi]|uniref:Uncharacterized protein n=1 Tax=Microdochium bolleyi TaxID=196109 RepID=A0A136J4W3_9PEZI|nr:hypothetical protein Micbo1qcDRAFT_162093 [Microdochium bolleyi]
MGGPMHMSSPIEEAELLYLKHLLTTLLRLVGALAAEGPVSRFEVILRKLALSDGAFAMPGPVRGAILPAMTHLKALFLDLCTMAPPTMVEDSESGIRNSYNYHLLQLLASTENIEHLRINCKDPQSRIGVNELFTWLVAQSDEDAAKSLSSRQYPGLPQLPPPIGFPKLERIEIGFALLEADTLLDLFKKFKTSLQAINLHKINLAATREQQTDKVNLWARLLNGMAALDLSLTSIVLEEVGQGSESYRCLPVKFNSTTGQDRKMAWSGRATLHGLKDIHTALEIEFPEDEGMHPGVHMTDEDEDEEEFDDMDDVDDMDEGEGNDGDASGGDGD